MRILYALALLPSRPKPLERHPAAQHHPFYARSQGPGRRRLPLHLGSHHEIRWKIPSLGEVVTGHTHGQPMPIRRSVPTPGLTLAVTAEGPLTLLYKVTKDGRPVGEGRMTLVEDGRAWLDLSWPAGHPEQAGALVYVRK